MKTSVIQTGGKQYVTQVGNVIKVEKLPLPVGSAVEFDKVLLLADEEGVRIGNPFIKNSVTRGKVVRSARDKKKIVFKYHSKNRYRKMKGHRQAFSEIEIMDIA